VVKISLLMFLGEGGSSEGEEAGKGRGRDNKSSIIMFLMICTIHILLNECDKNNVLFTLFMSVQ